MLQFMNLGMSYWLIGKTLAELINITRIQGLKSLSLKILERKEV